jgi:uncharacterized protein (DUF58 family)
MLPARRLIILVAATSPLWFVAAVVPAAWVIPTGCLLVLAGLSVWNYLHTPNAGGLAARRILPARLSLDSEYTVRLNVENLSRRRILLEIRDAVPECLVADSEPADCLVEPGATVDIPYRVRVVKRGVAEFPKIHCRVQAGPALVHRQFSLNVSSRSKVYPRFLGVDRYDLLALIDQREEARRTSRRVRERGSDFESLRPYNTGDDLRQVDWKVSAKRGTLISRNYQIEKGQQLTILIDGGRFMVEEIGGRPRFEHALNAAVMLSYVAQKRGDAVSMACFSNRIEAYMPSTKGQLIVPRVLETLFDVRPRNVESDYWHVFAQALARLQRRSLIVLLSEVLDRAGSSGLINNLVRATRKHLILCVVMVEAELYGAADALPSDLPSTYRKAAASYMSLERQLALADMRSRGIMVLETSPQAFSIQLVRKYLEIRRTGLL